MTAFLSDFPAVQIFDVHGDSTKVSKGWQKWLCSFEIYCTCNGVTDNELRKVLLLHYGGEEH